MATKQGSLALLDDPVAQHLLHSPLPAHLAYTWRDGTPRVIPIAFHWNGREIVVATPPDAPKLKALRDGAAVAVTIDTDRPPFKVLSIRGVVRMDVVEGLAPEYEAACLQLEGEEAGKAWLAQAKAMCPSMVRIFISPTWVGILDFETRFPSAIERAIARMQVPA